MYRSLAQLGGQLLGLRLLQFSNASCRLRTHDVTTPVTADLEEKEQPVTISG